MTRSSGVHAYQVDMDLECMACDWAGLVEVTVDEELNLILWVCPFCTTEHEEDFQ